MEIPVTIRTYPHKRKSLCRSNKFIGARCSKSSLKKHKKNWRSTVILPKWVPENFEAHEFHKFSTTCCELYQWHRAESNGLHEMSSWGWAWINMKFFSPGFAVRKSHAPPTGDLGLLVKPAFIVNTHIITIDTKTRVTSPNSLARDWPYMYFDSWDNNQDVSRNSTGLSKYSIHWEYNRTTTLTYPDPYNGPRRVYHVTSHF